METIKIFTDGGARGNPGPAAIGVYITDSNDKEVYSFGKTIGETTNNVAEYQAVIEALTWLYNHRDNFSKDLHIRFFLDSKLICSQIKKEFKVKKQHLQELLSLVWEKEKLLRAIFTYTHIRREYNKQADRLVNQALDNRS